MLHPPAAACPGPAPESPGHFRARLGQHLSRAVEPGTIHPWTLPRTAGPALRRVAAGRPPGVPALVGLLVFGLSVLCAPPAAAGTGPTGPPERSVTDIVPVPVAATADPEADSRLSPRTVISAGHGAEQVAQYLGELLRPSTGYRLPVVGRGTATAATASRCCCTARRATFGAEGYVSTSTAVRG